MAREIPSGTFPLDHEATDYLRTCTHCSFLLVAEGSLKNCTLSTSEVKLHTLIYGSTYIRVSNMQCPNCQRWTVFDGRDEGLFAYSMRTVLARELLDYWLYSLAMLGQTFREAFKMSLHVSRTSSAKYARWDGFDLAPLRLVANQAFSAFLKCIEYSDEAKHLYLFSCKTCESNDARGRRILRVVVLYGTATGVLGRLPVFDRPRIKRFCRKQHFQIPVRTDSRFH